MTATNLARAIFLAGFSAFAFAGASTALADASVAAPPRCAGFFVAQFNKKTAEWALRAQNFEYVLALTAHVRPDKQSDAIAAGYRIQALIGAKRAQEGLALADSLLAAAPNNIIAMGLRTEALLALARSVPYYAQAALDQADVLLRRANEARAATLALGLDYRPRDLSIAMGLRFEALMALGRALEARDQALAAKSLDANDTKANMQYARALLALGEFDAALAQLAKPNMTHLETLLRGEALLGLQRPAKALATADYFIESRPNDTRAMSLRYRALAALGQKQEAREQAQQLLRLEPQNRDAMRFVMSEFSAEGKSAAAREASSDFISRFGDDLAARAIGALSLLALGDANGAAEQAQILVDRFPNSSLGPALLGLAYDKLGLAPMVLQNAAKHPQNAFAQALSIRALATEKKLAAKPQVFAGASPLSVASQWALADAFFQDGEFAKARATLLRLYQAQAQASPELHAWPVIGLVTIVGKKSDPELDALLLSVSQSFASATLSPVFVAGLSGSLPWPTVCDRAITSSIQEAIAAEPSTTSAPASAPARQNH